MGLDKTRRAEFYCVLKKMFSKNWIIHNIKRKINKKQALLNIYIKSKTELDLYSYKSFKNKLTRIIKWLNKIV